MAADIEKVRWAARRYADTVRSVLPVYKAVLYGSYASGTASERSDVDVCFFLDSYEEGERNNIMLRLLSLTEGYKGIYFEPIVFTRSELDAKHPFALEVVNTGMEI
jgi:predicted nucleotidyltransferase